MADHIFDISLRVGLPLFRDDMRAQEGRNNRPGPLFGGVADRFQAL